ncbi:flavin reductase family protein [Clostridium niameyense]|uniref:Flavin reductase family protein n=1 Tax=Clostridium niameyense TaxID=1622073 RepID=A0A6M0RDF9_9CLOT|nr:flavin reductase family protein [Clostridium niameyense]NEZ47599.1 flavin reductase family protein [Clostridium niameyense]
MAKVKFKGSAMLNPVPIALITSKEEENNTNVFTVGWIGTACTKPPIISIAIRPERLSYKYIKESSNLVVNLPSKNMVKAVDYCGVRSGKNEDKIKNCNFTLHNSSEVTVPYIEECPINLECKVKNIIPLGTHDLFLCEILCVNVNEDLIDTKGKIHFEKANLMCYSHGEYFPLPEKSIGKFGYSVQKKKSKKHKHKKS